MSRGTAIGGRRAPASALFLAVAVLVVLAPGGTRPSLADEEVDGLVRLMEEMVELEGRIVSKLRDDRRRWNEAMPLFLSAVGNDLSAASLFRHRLERATVALERRIAWRSDEIRKAVLLRLAAVDLAIDELAAARMEEIRRLEATRAEGLDDLVSLMGGIRTNQEELLRRLRDDSVGGIDTGLIATAITEARRLRDALEDEERTEPPDYSAQRERIEEGLERLRELLRAAREGER